MGRKIKLRKPRRARGTGTIFPDKRRGGFVARVPVGKYPSGRTRYVEVRAKTQAEVIEKMKKIEPPSDSMTVGEWLTRWLHAIHVRPSTRQIYTCVLNKRVKPALGAIRLKELTTWQIESLVAEWSRGPDAMAPATIRATLGKLSSCLQAAVRAQLITRNPTSHVRRPRTPRVRLDLFSPVELRQIIDLASTRREWYPFALCAAVGCRIGEALAIQKGDFDEAAGELSISRTWTRAGIGPPKSESGERTIRVPELIRPLFADTWSQASYPTQLYRWGGFLKQLGLRHRTLHQLRHSVASHAIAAGVSVTNVARDLGDTVATIVDVYLHPTPGLDICAAMEGLLNGPLGGTKVAATGKQAGKHRRNAAG